MDYRNEVGIILINNGFETVYIEDGERIAQLVFAIVLRADLVETTTINETERKGGFGHTGVQ